MLDEAHQVLDLDDALIEWRQRAGEERASLGARPGQCTRTLERDRLEAPGMAGREVARVERLQRVADDDLVPCTPAVLQANGGVDDVEQLADGHGRQLWRIGALVVSGVG